jgi:hypothetical protein
VAAHAEPGGSATTWAALSSEINRPLIVQIVARDLSAGPFESLTPSALHQPQPKCPVAGIRSSGGKVAALIGTPPKQFYAHAPLPD